MANQDGPSAVNFQAEAGNVEFQSELTAQEGGGLAQRVTEAAQNVNWNKVAVGAGAAAAVAGAAYAAKKFIGSGESSENSSGGGRGKS